MGMLQVAGALGGLGQGIEKVGEEQTKENATVRADEMIRMREEAITRLQGAQQSALSAQGAAQQSALETQSSAQLDAREDKSIAGRAAVSDKEIRAKEHEDQLGREFTGGENEAHRASQEKIAAGHDAARLGAAKAAHSATQKPLRSEFTKDHATVGGGVGPDGQLIPQRTLPILTHADGSQWIAAGDKILPFSNSNQNGYNGDISTMRRAPVNEVQKLLSNPLGTTPSGMSARDSFVNRNGYLPQSYMGAANAARQAQYAAQAPQGGGAPGATTSEQDEQPDPAETETDTP